MIENQPLTVEQIVEPIIRAFGESEYSRGYDMAHGAIRRDGGRFMAQTATVKKILEIITQTLKAERQRREDMVEAERERIKKDMLVVMKEWHGTGTAMVNDYFKALTQPNNNK